MKLRDEITLVLVDYSRRADAGDVKRSTLKAVNNAFNIILEYWGDKAPEEITTESWASLQDWYEAKNPGATHFNIKKYATVLTNHLCEKGALLKKPKIRDRFARRERTQRRKRKNWVYSREEISKLDSAAKDIIERTQLRLAYLMGFRISDVVNLTWERIITTGKYTYVDFNGSDDKADKIARCPMPQSIVELLLQIPKISRFVFPQQRNTDKHIMTQQINFNEIKHRAGITRGTFHSLRHYRLTEDCANPKLTLAQISKMRRVSVQVLMEHYVHTREEDMTLMIEETK